MDGKETKKSWVEYVLDLLALIMVSLIVGAFMALLQTIAYLINPDINQINPLEPLPYILVTGFVIYGINLIINSKNKTKNE